MILSLMVDARALPANGFLSIGLAEAGNFLRWTIVTAGLLALFLADGFKTRLHFLNGRPLRTALVALILHIGIYFALLFITLVVFQQYSRVYTHYLWLALVIASAVSWCLILSVSSNWRKFLANEKAAIAAAAIGGIVIVLLGFYFQRYWGSMTEFTLGSTKTLLSLFYDDIIYDPNQRKLGLDAFWVFVAPVCSGIEGAVLAVSIAAVYLYLSRQFLKFPHALVLLPLACLFSFALNIVRITALIMLGAEVSPALAIGGFHSVAGWITAILVALLIVFVFSSWKWIQKTPNSEHKNIVSPADSQIAQAILIPFVIFTGATLIGSIFVTKFDYYYPVKAILTLGVLLFFWKVYDFRSPDRKLEAIAAGILVAILWVMLIPADADGNQNISVAFSSMPLWALIGWVFFRLLGFWFIAPILEELVFRSYLLSRLSGQAVSNHQKPIFSLFALIASAVLFGLLHNAWLAGMIAGLLFAYIRFRGDSIVNSIIAHSIANILITLWAVYSGNWALI